MAVTRRDVLKAAGALAGASAFPIVFRGGTAWADVDPATRLRRRLVVVFLAGGNDGLNTVVPRIDVPGGASRTVYERVRPVIGLPVGDLLALDRTGDDAAHGVGLNPRLPFLKQMYDADRLAIVQGVDYPGHDYSHFNSTDFWESGQPMTTVTSGWIGRHFDRVGITEGELRGVALGRELPLTFQGEEAVGRINTAVAFESMGSVRFGDGADTNLDARAKHDQWANYGATTDLDELRRFFGGRCQQTRDLVTQVAPLPVPPFGGTTFATQMLNARAMLQADLGVEVVFVAHYGPTGYDTHADQVARHPALLRELDEGCEAFFLGSRAGVPITNAGAIDPDLESRTTVLVWSEFGRTLGDNGSGTDHGAAAPVFLLGPPQPAGGSGALRLVPGLHGEHPAMGSAALANSDLSMTTDVRRLYQALLTQWLEAPGEPYYEAAGVTELPGLFGTA